MELIRKQPMTQVNNSQDSRFSAPRRGGQGRLSVLLLLLVGLCSVFITTVASAEDEVVITDEARRHFKAGVNSANDPDGARYADAYREFRLAYAESPSWKILGNLGIAAMKLERDGEAIEAFKIYLQEGGDDIDAGERAQVTRDLEALEASVTWVTLEVTPTGGTLVDHRVPVAGQSTVNHYELSEATTRIGLHAGHHNFTIQLEGYEEQRWSFDASGGELTKSLELEKVEPKKDPSPVAEKKPEKETVTERPIPVGVWIGAGATGLFAVGATVTGILATQKKSQFNEANDGTDPLGAEELKSSGKTLNLVTDIMLGSAIVAAGVTTVLYFTRPEVTREVASVRITPTPLVGGGGLWMHGHF